MNKRHITQLIRSSLSTFPAVMIIGARQVGKSTLAQQLVNEGVVERYDSLDDLTTLEAARLDPDGFLHRYHNVSSVALDEIQRVPDLLRALKKSIDENRRAGRFLLTGSANILTYPGVTESLAGRMDIIHLEGFSVSELHQEARGSAFIDHLFVADPIEKVSTYCETILKHKSVLSKMQLRELIFYGGFPEIALSRSATFSERWFSAYQTAYIERDVRDLTKLLDVIPFSKLLRLAGLRTANLLNVKNLGADVGIDQRTVSRYLHLLEITFQANQLTPWHTSQRKRLVKTPKFYLNDSGFACFLHGMTNPQQLETYPQLGALFETWAWAELRKLLASTAGISTSFYRTHQGREVDFVLEKGQCRWGIEIKWTHSVTKSDFAGLIDMQEAMGENAFGIIFYMGNSLTHFSKKLLAAPLTCLLF